MNAKVENNLALNSLTVLDYLALIAGVLVIGAGVSAFYYFDAQWAVWLRVLVVVGALIAGGIIAALSQPGRRFLSFLQEALIELRKVVWPTKQETMQTTLVVVVAVILVGIVLFIIDWLLALVVRILMG